MGLGTGDRGVGYGLPSMRPPLAALTVAVLVLAGCGSERQPSQSGGQSASLGGAYTYEPYQPRDKMLKCLRGKGVKAVAVGQDAIQFLPLPASPRIVVAATPDAATALQVRGRAEGAQLMGSALVYANQASNRQIKRIQDCV